MQAYSPLLQLLGAADTREKLCGAIADQSEKEGTTTKDSLPGLRGDAQAAG